MNTRTGEVHAYSARKVIMATGPFRVPYPALTKPYRLHTMPIDLSGDGHAAMLRAGAVMGKLELGSGSIHPWHYFTAPGMEMLCGLGQLGIFVNGKGERFFTGNLRQKLPGRSALGVGIATEMKAGRGPVCVDMSYFTPEQRRLLKQVIPIIMGNIEAAGFDLAKDQVPYTVTPAATNSVSGGGAHVDGGMRTNIPGLYAVGNCSDGAHMTMSQTLPECAAMGFWAGQHAGETFRDVPPPKLVQKQVTNRQQTLLSPLMRKGGPSYDEVHKRMESLYDHYITYTLTDEQGQKALAGLRSIIHEDLPRITAREPRELAKTLGLTNFLEFLEPVLTVLLHRKESRGNVVRPDYPYTDNRNWLKYTFCRKEATSEIGVWDEPLPPERLAGVERKKELHPFFRQEAL
jgi:succinate dehydrogenase/fumarate reductase flavoprotein subunit